jgi:hypothetical protein
MTVRTRPKVLEDDSLNILGTDIGSRCLHVDVRHAQITGRLSGSFLESSAQSVIIWLIELF